ncbi:MAG: glycosyltransferase [Deltaproteobacteria bacterium]|nr:glycosyltransferase [Deltaproteobacteria bacterium]
MQVSVIISFYQRLKHLEFCLDALELCSDDFCEVVIADDGSDKACVEALGEKIKKYHYPIIHAWHPKDGFRLSAARNNGIRHARGNYFIFLDCDFIVLPDTIRRHIEEAESGRYVAGLCKYLTEEQTGILFERGVDLDMLERFYQELPDKQIRSDHRRFIIHSILRRFHLAKPRKERCSSHFSIHRRDIEYINGYDENFVGWGGEDEDLAHRMALAGFRGKSVIPAARILHLWHPKELGGMHWKTGANVTYLNRENVAFFCENGLTKKTADPSR